MTEAAEVKVKLVVDSNADKVTSDLKNGLEGVGQSAHATGKKIDFSLKGNFGSLKTIAGAALGGLTVAAAAAGAAMVGAAFAAGNEFLDAQKQVRILAGDFLLLSNGPATFKEIKAYAADVKDDLKDMAINIGTTDEALVGVFNDIISRGGKSIDQTMKLTESMAQAGRAIPGGAEALGEAFRNIEMGIIRARNPIVGMIAATHTLKGNAKSVAAQMMLMTPEKQMALAEKAIAKMGERMKDAPMSFGEMITSTKQSMSSLLETAGEPIIKALTPVIKIVRDIAEQASRADSPFARIAQSFGETVGAMVEIAGPIITETVHAISDSSEDIKKTFDALYGPAKSLFGYIYENKEAFATTIGDVLRMIISVAGALVRAISTVRDTIFSVLGAVGKVIPGLGEFMQQEKQEGTRKQMVAAIQGTTQQGAPSEQGVDYEGLKKQFMEGAKDQTQAMADFDAAWKRATDDHNAMLASVAGAEQDAMTDNAAHYAQMFDIAAKGHDKGAQQYVLQFLQGNQSMQNALIKAGPDIFQTGVEGFYKALEDAGNSDLAKSIRAGMTKGRLGDIGKAEIHQTFTGPIQIKQDFRDADPDRVVTMFREDLASRAASRIGARGVGPFGI